MRFDDGQWHPLTETTFSEKKLVHLIRRLEGMSTDIEYIASQLKRRANGSEQGRAAVTGPTKATP